MIKILIDTQEKLPYSFNNILFCSKKVSLETGDYQLEDWPKGPVIERKSLEDFVKSIQEDRFFRELERMKEFDMPVILVETSIPQVLLHSYNSKLPPSEIIRIGINILKDYKIPIIYCSDRQHAIYYAEQLFQEYTSKRVTHKVGDHNQGEKKKTKRKQKEEDIL